MADIFLEHSHLYCVECSRRLGESTDDQPDWPAGPLCGECYQSRQLDDEIWASESDDLD